MHEQVHIYTCMCICGTLQSTEETGKRKKEDIHEHTCTHHNIEKSFFYKTVSCTHHNTEKSFYKTVSMAQKLYKSLHMYVHT